MFQWILNIRTKKCVRYIRIDISVISELYCSLYRSERERKWSAWDVWNSKKTFFWDLIRNTWENQGEYIVKTSIWMSSWSLVMKYWAMDKQTNTMVSPRHPMRCSYRFSLELLPAWEAGTSKRLSAMLSLKSRMRMRQVRDDSSRVMVRFPSSMLPCCEINIGVTCLLQLLYFQYWSSSRQHWLDILFHHWCPPLRQQTFVPVFVQKAR